MLCNLDIKNIAVIENISFAPGDGMTVLTGETGAGKSVIIDSVNLILGARTNKSLVRYGADKATVSAMFTLSEKLSDILSENGIEAEDDIIISREITQDGKSIARINGTMIPVSFLKDISHYLVNIHGQHDNQSLLNPEKHINFLDSYAQIKPLYENYKTLYDELKQLENELKSLNRNEQDRLAKIDLLKYQTEELSSADLKSGEEESLKEEQSIIENSEKISSGVSIAYNALYGDEQNAYDNLNTALSQLSSISQYDETLSDIYSRLSDATYTIEDISHELRSYADNCEYDEERLDEISERINLIKKLERKYGATVDDCIGFLNKASAELDDLLNSDIRMEELSLKIEETSKKAEAAADKLSKERIKAAKELSEQIEAHLHELDMGKAKFSVSVNKSNTLLPNGYDIVEFMFTANPGQPLGQLSKIASGGELSRVMLAMKTVLASSDEVDTLIFDEIDTGVSGGASQKIAKKLSLLGKSKQVICISHQPQLAAAADNNFKIEKHSDNDVTSTTIKLLDKKSRIEELARIIDGENITKTSIEHAREMLERGY